MKKLFKTSALVLAGLFLCACTSTSNNEQQTQSNTNMNPQKEKVQEVAGRKNFNHGLITPLPAIMIATYDENENPDVMMAAWGGQCGPNHICFNLSPHKTTNNLRLKQAFTISFADARTVVESDYFGLVSANNVPDKVARAGFTVTKSPNVDAPIINEYPLALECRVIEISETLLNETRVVGEIVNMSAVDSILDMEGKVDLGKLQPIIFDASHMTYRTVGEEVGNAWGSGKALMQE